MEWTSEDQAAAMRQGWGLWSPDGAGPLEIQKYDEADTFATDATAVVAVFQSAMVGDPLARKAWEVVQRGRADNNTEGGTD